MNKTKIFLFFAILFLLIIPKGINGDGLIRYESLDNIFFNASSVISSKYSIIGPLFSLPLLFLEKFLNLNIQITVLFNTMLFLLFWYIFRREFSVKLDNNFTYKFFLAVVFSSFYISNLTTYYAETFSSLSIFLAILYFCKEEKIILAIILFSLGVANTPALIIPGFLLLTYFAFKRKQIRYGFYILYPICLVLLENVIIRGHLFNSDYSNDSGFKTILPYSGTPNFSLPFWIGLISILFSFGKGLLFFMPFLFIKPNFKNLTPFLENVYKASMIFSVGLVLIYAKWWAWYGGVFWGPRFFLFGTLVASISLISNLNYKYLKTCSRIKLGVITISFLMSIWVAIANILSLTIKLPEFIFSNNFENEHLTWYTPHFSVLGYPLSNLTNLFSNEGLSYDLFVIAFFLILSSIANYYLGYDLIQILKEKSLNITEEIKNGLKSLKW